LEEGVGDCDVVLGEAEEEMSNEKVGRGRACSSAGREEGGGGVISRERVSERTDVLP
jgi:hypothetical protein